MLVSQILRTKGDSVFTTEPAEQVGEVAKLLHARKIGALVVMEADRVVGIVSERDVVRALAEHGASAMQRPVSDFMTSNVLFADPGETVDKMLERMSDRRIRHLPVCRLGRLVGMLSIGDLVKAKISEVEAEADGLKAYIAAS
jgi:CBS domain-containing protein